MNRCTAPAHPGDGRYVYGETCTWHGPIALVSTCPHRVDVSSHGEPERYQDLDVPCCPHCSGRLLEMATEDEFWNTVRSRERELPGYDEMLRWAAGKCFPDFDTLQNVYRQAMEGQS